MPSDTPENQVKEAIKKFLSKRTDTVLVSNPSGTAWLGKLLEHRGSSVLLGFARRVAFGCFAPGAPDMIGFQTRTITQDMVGQQIAQFVAVEIKAASGGRITLDQADVIDMLRKRGAKAAIINETEQLKNILDT